MLGIAGLLQVKPKSRTKYLDSLMIKEVLEKPLCVFGGLKRENMADGRCYCGVAKTRFLDKGIKVPFPPDRLFVVFVNDRDEIFDWDMV